MTSAHARPLLDSWEWRAPGGSTAITTIDAHTGGEPLRIIVGAIPGLPEGTVLEKRQHFIDHHDALRRGLLLEPRGHADMYGAVVTHALDDADLDVFFLNADGYSSMCGHAVLAIAKVVVEAGAVVPDSPSWRLRINAPAGRVTVRVVVDDNTGAVTGAAFQNVPSFVVLRDEHVAVPGLGDVAFDVAFGGAFYAIVDAARLGLGLDRSSYATLVQAGRDIKAAVLDRFTIQHPVEAELGGLFGVILTGPAHEPTHHSRNVTVFEDGMVDRSATGTGLSARAALHVARGELAIGETVTIESILGSTLTVTASSTTTVAGRPAIVPEVGGAAHVMGMSRFFFDPTDPFAEGFTLR